MLKNIKIGINYLGCSLTFRWGKKAPITRRYIRISLWIFSFRTVHELRYEPRFVFKED